MENFQGISLSWQEAISNVFIWNLLDILWSTMKNLNKCQGKTLKKFYIWKSQVLFYSTLQKSLKIILTTTTQRITQNSWIGLSFLNHNYILFNLPTVVNFELDVQISWAPYCQLSVLFNQYLTLSINIFSKLELIFFLKLKKEYKFIQKVSRM